MTDRPDDEMAEIEKAAEDLGEVLGWTRQQITAFTEATGRSAAAIEETTRQMKRLETGIQSGVRGAFDDLVGGAPLGEAFRGLGHKVSDSAYTVATDPLTDTLGSGLLRGLGGLAVGGLGAGGAAVTGAAAQGAAGPVNVTMNVSTPDVRGFERSRGQLAAQLGRAVSRGQRNR